MPAITSNSETITYDSWFASTKAKYISELKDSAFRERVSWDWVRSLTKGAGGMVGLWTEFPVQLGSYNGASDLTFGGTDTISPQNVEIATIGKVKPFEKYLMAQISQDIFESNKGTNRKYDYVKAQLDNAVESVQRDLNTDVWSPTQDTKKIISVAVLISTTTTTGTVETLNRATYTNWRQTNTDAGAASFTSVGLNNMRTLFHSISRGPTKGKPDTIFWDFTVDALWERVTDPREWTEMATSGEGKKPIISEAPVFRSCRIKAEPTDYPNSTTARMLNSSTWHYSPFREDKPGDARQPVDGLWYAYPVGYVGTLWCDALRWNGILSNFLAS